AITNLLITGATLAGTNRIGNGFLTVSNGALTDQLTIGPAGALNFAGTGNKTIYGLNLLNQGTWNWNGGFIQDGGTPGTVVSNLGLFHIQSDNTVNYGFGSVGSIINLGTMRKSAGPGTTTFANQYFTNFGLVDIVSGNLLFNGNGRGAFGGTVNVAPGSFVTL